MKSNINEGSPNQLFAGRFEIESQFDSLGMNSVFLAFDRVTRTEMVLKIPNELRPNFQVHGDRQDGMWIEEFAKIDLKSIKSVQKVRIALREEVRKTRSLQNNPHVVKIYDYHETDHLFFISMEYVQGKTLLELLKLQPENRFNPRELPQYIDPLFEVLTDAHQQGKQRQGKIMIYRDLKPENVIYDSVHKMVRILDFGLAFYIQGTRQVQIAEQLLRQATFSYMSPEHLQVDYKPSPLDDQFSLACLIHLMLSSRSPFYDKDPEKTLINIQFLPYPGLPQYPAIEKVLKKALEKERENRYASIEAFKKAFQKALKQTLEQTDDNPVREATAYLPFTDVDESGSIEKEQTASSSSESTTTPSIEESESVLRNTLWKHPFCFSKRQWWMLALIGLILLLGGGFHTYQKWGWGKEAVAKSNGSAVTFLKKSTLSQSLESKIIPKVAQPNTQQKGSMKPTAKLTQEFAKNFRTLSQPEHKTRTGYSWKKMLDNLAKE